MNEDKRKIKPETLEILRTTILNMFTEGLYHEVGIREICTSAKVSPKTIYKYFGNKDTLLLSCLEKDFNELYEQVLEATKNKTDPLEKAKIFSLVSAQFYAQRPAIARITFQNIPTIYWIKKQAKGLFQYQDLLMNILNDNIQSGNFSNIQNEELLYDIFSGSFNRIMLRWVGNNFTDDIIKQITEFTDVISLINTQSS